MKAFHELFGDDREWALDNSLRRFRVRFSRLGDLPQRDHYPPDWITIVRLSDGFRMVLTERCLRSGEPFEDTDWYAARRLGLVNESRRTRGQQEV
ncbi:hypothetical protein MKK58_02915 [Methylobacterium sp. J-078]|uniref:hypothetical protein n=1 Tax=Methylobacterium sp. J-078 TaxID=2836657 RepID=UPI001FB96DD0|nr:hypothetical protein [Methylobacterium sp. J-078]MCJ2043494.1 hypothetical protein [Methylobacterium sp. J-078]